MRAEDGRIGPAGTRQPEENTRPPEGAEPSGYPPASAAGWRGVFTRLEGSLGFLKNLSLFSLAAVIAAAFFQFNQWSIEKSLDRAKTDYDLAIHAFEKAVDQLSKAQNLQETLFLTYHGAAGAPAERATYHMARAKEAFADYASAQRDLRIEIDELIYNTQLYIDWASDLDSDKSLTSYRYGFDPLNNDKLNAVKFDCAAPSSVPDYSSFDKLGANVFDGIVVDWRSAKHQLVVFYHCFDELNARLFPVRLWASGNLPDSSARLPDVANASDITAQVRPILDNQIQRLNALSMLMLTRIEQIRRLNELPSFFDFYFRSRDRILPDERDGNVTKPD